MPTKTVAGKQNIPILGISKASSTVVKAYINPILYKLQHINCVMKKLYSRLYNQYL